MTKKDKAKRAKVPTASGGHGRVGVAGTALPPQTASIRDRRAAGRALAKQVPLKDKSFSSAERFCRSYDELRNSLRLQTRHNQHVPANRRRLLHLRRAAAALAIFEAA